MELGRYKHYKGNEYEVIGIATHSETLEAFVVYKELYNKNNLWIRPVAMFADRVFKDGKYVDRFKYIGDDKVGKVILNDDYVFAIIRFLSKVAVGDNPPGRNVNLEGLNLFFRSIGISVNTLVLWNEEFFISAISTRIDLLQHKMEEFFIRKYRDWMSFPNSFEVKIDIDLEGI